VNQAAWKCDCCRKSGLENDRRCGFRSDAAAGPERIVWARRRIATSECPVSYITAESLYLIEQYYVFRRFGSSNIHEAPSRWIEAFLLLEQEQAEEQKHGGERS
jgi:hypothetical protein